MKKSDILKKAAQLRNLSNSRKRHDQKAVALAWATGLVILADLSQAVYGYRSCSNIYTHLALGLRAVHEDSKDA